MTIEQERLTPTQEDREALGERLEKLLAKATALPWRYDDDDEGSSMGWISGKHATYPELPGETIFDVAGDSAQQAANAELAVAAINSLPTLLAALKSPPIAGGEGVSPVPAQSDDTFALLSPPEYEPVLDDDRKPTGYHRDRATGEVVTLANEWDEDGIEPTTSGDVGKLCERLLLAGGNAFPHEPKTAKEGLCMEAATLLTQMEAREVALRDALETAESALDQLLDDMGETGQCVCPAAKFEAIDALANVRRTLNPTPTEER